MNPVGSFSLEAKLIAGAVALLVLLVGVLWVVHDLEAKGAAKEHAARVEERAQAQAIAASAIATNQAEGARRAAAIQGAASAAELQASAARADAVAARNATDRLRQRFAASGGSCAGNPAAASLGSPAASGPGWDVRSDVFGVVAEAGRRLAARCDAYHVPGAEAEHSYDALSP